MKFSINLIAAILLALTSITFAQNSADPTKVAYSSFQDPPAQFKGTRWFTFAMGDMTEENVKRQINAAADTGAYGGWMATPDGRGADPNGVSYLNDAFFRVYKIAVEEGIKRNFPMTVMYDEQQFPSGMAGGLFRAKYPDLIGKSIEKVEQDVTGPKKVELTAPINNGNYIGAVLLNLDTFECVDVSTSRVGQTLSASIEVPQGNWKAMLVYLDPTANRRGIVDYLDPKAVDGMIEVMHQRYYDNLKEYFGKVIKMTFFDEPAMHHTEFRGRLWTPVFNQEFQKKHGYSPMKYYPALWYDIGPDTAAARNALFGFRSDMYAENYIGRLAKWCEERGVKSTGHLDQEESPNPVPTNGDLMKAFKYQSMPGHDDIWFVGRSNATYKIMTSAAFNWDKPVATAETYAAYRAQYVNATGAYRTAMDQHAMGVGFQVGNYPRGVDPKEFGNYLGRIQYLLQHGRHAADIAILYPIQSLNTAYFFAQPARVSQPPGRDSNFYYALEGGIVPPEIDYLQLGELIFRGYRQDYTFLHPEVLETNTTVVGDKLIINNKENREEFRVVFVPGGDTMSLATAKKLQAFYNAGGKIIATSKLPTRASDFGKDKELQKIIDEVFGIPLRGPIVADLRANTDEFKTWFVNANPAGGQAWFLPRLDLTMMNDALNFSNPTPDVSIKMPVNWPLKVGQAYDGSLTYIHKVKDGKDIYFFSNSTDQPVDTQVVLRGKKTLATWNPHTGERSKAEVVPTEGDDATTTVRLVLDPVKSTFFVTE